MKRLFVLVIVLGMLIPASVLMAQSDDPFVNKIIEIGKTDNQVMRHLHYATNVIGSRMTGSDGYLNGCEWVVREFKKWGVQVKLEVAGEVAVGFNKGPAWGRIVEPEEKFLHFGTPSYTAGTKGIQKGPVVVAPKTESELASMKNKLKGAWVLLPDTAKGWARGGRRGIPSKLVQKIEQAGILGTIRQTRPNQPIRVLYGPIPAHWDWLPTIPDITLRNDQYHEILNKVKRGEKVILEFEIRNNFKPGPVKYYNVIAWIPGTRWPDQYLIFGGHFDSIDGAPGAVDNGSGFTPAMEMLRMLMKAGVRPKRTIMVHLWAAEEKGLWGSKEWVRRHKDMLPKIGSVFNRDGGTDAITGIRVSEAMLDDFKLIAEPIYNLNSKFPFTVDVRRARKRPTRGGGSDGSSFQIAGVPALGWKTSDPDDITNYGKTWHTKVDTYNEVVQEYQEHSAIVMALIAYGLGNLNHPLDTKGYFLDSDKK